MATTRTLTAPQAGPVLADVQLLGAGGIVTVRTDRTRKEAEITVRTADDSGDSADAVRDADLHWDARGALVAHVRGKGVSGTTMVNSGGGTFIGGNHYGVIQHVQNNYGSMVAVSSGDLNISGDGTFHAGGRMNVLQGSAPIEITAVVPEGSSVTARAQGADIITDGTFATVAAATQGGDIEIANAPHIVAKTQGGDIRLGRTGVVDASAQGGNITIRDFGGTARLNTMAGDIHVHATAGGDITAKTMAGDVNVTATEQALNDDLDVRASSMAGSVNYPRRHNTGGPRRRR